MGDLSKEYIFYIAKKYKCIVKKAPKSGKSEAKNGSYSYVLNQQSVNKITFLKSLDNSDGKSDKQKQNDDNSTV